MWSSQNKVLSAHWRACACLWLWASGIMRRPGDTLESRIFMHFSSDCTTSVWKKAFWGLGLAASHAGHAVGPRGYACRCLTARLSVGMLSLPKYPYLPGGLGVPTKSRDQVTSTHIVEFYKYLYLKKNMGFGFRVTVKPGNISVFTLKLWSLLEMWHFYFLQSFS